MKMTRDREAFKEEIRRVRGRLEKERLVKEERVLDLIEIQQRFERILGGDPREREWERVILDDPRGEGERYRRGWE
jgi:hypothetical protein